MTALLVAAETPFPPESGTRLRNVHHGDPASLARVFLGELWRGRDNARVSLRTPRSWRTLASGPADAVLKDEKVIAAYLGTGKKT